jgi:UDP-N-acetyl-D-galactosamine dehydrogenase|tara:strand:- start:490 stop:1761 length:1272 start_codon:yes stop_codon:yes gene_type:complete
MIDSKIKIGVIGLGYVGLPLAVEFSKTFDVLGFDISKDRIDGLAKNFDETLMISKKQLSEFKGKFSLKEIDLAKCNIYIVTVPTPIDKGNKPNFSPLINASNTISKFLLKGDIVIFESTVYPGATEEICVPELEKSGLKYNRDFFCGYSPERINPGDDSKSLRSITKIVSGSNKKTALFLKELYSTIIDAGIYLAPNIKTAEAAKVIENTQRDLNIALVNELSKIFFKLGIDTHEVLDAAATKWNFAKYTPGLVGGHCIGVDPYYLTHKAQLEGYNPEIILSGRRINDSMHEFIFERVLSHIIKNKIPLKSLKVLILGMSFKENCNDLRNSKVFDLVELFRKQSIKIFHSEPYINNLKVGGSKNINFEALKKSNQKFDVIIIAAPHDEFYASEKAIKSKLKDKNSLIFDIKGRMKKGKNYERL